MEDNGQSQQPPHGVESGPTSKPALAARFKPRSYSASINAALPAYAGRRATLWRTLQTFNGSRVLIALVLLGFVSVSGFHGTVGADTIPFIQLCSVYLLASVAFMLLTIFSHERFLLQLATQLAVDVLVLSSLYLIAGGARSGLAILYLFPLAGGAILAPRLIALFFASVAALVLLIESLLEALRTASESDISTAGLYGMAFFGAVLLLNELASRLLRQEELAEQRGQDLRLQQAINRLIIADMGDGVLVIDADTTIVTANPAAAEMLDWSTPGLNVDRRLTSIPALTPITEAFFRWVENSKTPDERSLAEVPDASPQFIVIKSGDMAASAGEAATTPTTQSTAQLRSTGRYDQSIHLKIYFAKVNTIDQQEDRTVIFLQDVSEIENKAQDLKLASMGRLTASIAHEVRNPLSAISYAASLLEEETPTPTQKRLLRIIDENVTRLNRMIEDILKLSRKAQLNAAPLKLADFFAEVLVEFNATNSLADDLIAVSDLHDHVVRFDPMHLREVVMNLLSNAIRYASGSKGSVRIAAVQGITNRTELHIRDDGPPMSAEVRAHLFEPFYTTSSKGTGLGLYLARELCLNNDAMLDYEFRRDALHDLQSQYPPNHFDRGGVEAEINEVSGRFVITFAVVI